MIKWIIVATLLLRFGVAASSEPAPPPEQGPDFRADFPAAFRDAFARIEKEFAPEIRARGRRLSLHRSILGSRDNSAFLPRARHDRIEYSRPSPALQTQRQIDYTLCHELGHGFGGAPRFRDRGHLISFEAQADFFAAAKCIRRLWSSVDNEAALAGSALDPRTDRMCRDVYPEDAEYWLCRRSIHAALEWVQTFAVQYGVSKIPDLATPADPVSISISDYPKLQCRLDTMVAGALCRANPHDPFDATWIDHGGCAGKPNGGRPNCWFVYGRYPEKDPRQNSPFGD